ncbi:MAG: ATP-binding protein [Desulfobacterales bacterium]|nr:ATP-binding protein [Desulfobacterales bacterium]
MRATDTIRLLEVKNLAALIFCCGLALFIGFMLTGQFISHQEIEQKRVDDLQQNLEKRSTAVDYFFSERFSDLENLSESRELNAYFENMALGMSMKYGLKSSLFLAAKKFYSLLVFKTVGQEPIYKRVVFISAQGEILIDTTQGAQNSLPDFCTHLTGIGEKSREVLGDGLDIAVSLPFYFKKEYTGQLVSFLSFETVEQHLVRQASETGGVYFMTPGSGTLRLPEYISLDLPGNGEIDPQWFENGEIRVFKGSWNKGKTTRVIALGAKIPNTPFSIISLTRTDTMSGKAIFAIMTAFVLFLGVGIFFIWRSATQKLIIGVRLAEIRDSEQRLREVVEHLPIPIGEYGLDLKIRYANKEAMSFFGYDQDDIDAGVRVLDLVDEDDRGRAYKQIKILQKEENPGPIEISARRKDGRRVWGKAIPRLIYENGVCVGVRTCFIDMTQRLKSEKETILAAEQEKFVLVGQVAGKMAHDFNNILGAIMGNAELTLLDCEDPEIRETLEIVLEQSKRGKILTQNLVAFAKDQEIKEEYFNINEKMDLVVNLLKKELKDITVIKKYEPDPPELLADPGMIEHALVNLVQNSVHAMGKTKNPVLGLTTRSHNNTLSITIQDNGCGIPEAYAKEVYSPSFSLKGSRDVVRAYADEVKGTGYGLSNVKKYVDKHKGTIEFVSEVDKGSRFTITLPIKAKALFPEEKKDMLEKPLIQGKRILVVEDEDAIAMVLVKILTSDPLFHQVEVARDGNSAIEVLDKEEFDLVSLDYILPGKINGLDIYNHIREAKKELPVLFISGNIRFLESMEALKASDPFMDHLSKPFENLDYAEKVNDWLQHH